MSLSQRRKIADNAAAALLAQRTRLSVHYSGLHDTLDRWRPTLLIGSGLTCGYLLGRRQTARLASAAVSLASLAMSVMRTPLGPLAMSALLGNRIRAAQRKPDSADSSNAG
ncbi:hypothetical protein [Dokdonella sp.]|uniref:hypothetical protein n=1 Tax=Dokdonella sp. TaxID=2291710 RepID=UPI003529747C